MKNLLTTGILLVFFGICFAIQAQIPCGSPTGGSCTNPADDYTHIVWRNPGDLNNVPDTPTPLSEVNQNLFYFIDDIPPVPFLGCPDGVPQTTINDFGSPNFNIGDEIGIFFERNDTLICVGYSVYLNDGYSTKSIVVYGDDISTTIQESFATGEAFEIMLIRKNGTTSYYVDFVIDGVNDYPCGAVYADPNGDFTDRGDSRLESLTVLDCQGIENGPNRLDDCGVCDSDPSNDNLPCAVCNDPVACNYDPNGVIIDNDVCIYSVSECPEPCNVIYGCLNATASNYDPNANCNDDSCFTCTTFGCIDSLACNYNPEADCPSNCFYIGCNDPAACNYFPTESCDDNSLCLYYETCDTDPCTNGGIDAWDTITCKCVLIEATIEGCTDPTAIGYNPNANCDDGSCNSSCSDPNACNFDPNTTNNDNCIYETACDTNPCSNGGIYAWDTITCSCILSEPTIAGCTDTTFANYDPTANCDMGCPHIYGCSNANACNYNPQVTINNGSCVFEDANCPDPCNVIYGCMDTTSSNYNPLANCELANSCELVYGCTDIYACNFNPLATINDGSCQLNCADPCGSCDASACNDPNACNYVPGGTLSPCDYGYTDCPDPCNTILGCTEISSVNYDPNANCDDGSCEYASPPDCSDPAACNYGYFSPCDYGYADCPDPCNPVLGCTDINACNFNSIACLEDGSCIETSVNTGLSRDGALYGITNFPINGNEIYTWYNGNDEKVAQFTNNPYFAPLEIGTYYLVVSDPDYPDCAQLLGPATITDLHGCCELESDGN